ncbi:hypothetical protein BD626DRAFT_451623 [Schizophyllum amplum]|uniref:Uncharacterized protein n=1 Tax=Schizophyllum amplum TaxID=97359 RepID=A0A550CP56_9AGAR|nr:hypothetical protein BD626DRAFT_451623 [Auriculariopsis ampla]
MSIPDVERILLGASNDFSPEIAPSTLSAILHAFFRRRSQPLDPDYVSESACANLLTTRPELYTLLERAVKEQDYACLWDCEILSFRDVDLRTRRPYHPTDTSFEQELPVFLKAHQKFISAFARSTVPLDSWTPSSVDMSATATSASGADSFISYLKIPDTSADSPCLALHDVGALINADILHQRLQNIFVPRSHTIFLNTSGSGKTRLVLEGLSQHWGFYIPCASDNSCLGSLDMDHCLGSGISNKRKFRQNAPWDEDSVQHNSWVAQNTFSRILLSRLILLKAFLDELEDKLTLDARHQWLLFQVLTMKLEHGDIFHNLTRKVDRVTQMYADEMFTDLLLDIKARYGDANMNIFCVLDEAQRANDAFRGAFGKQSTALREIASAYEKYDGITLILTGTHIDLGPFRRADFPEYRVCTDTGLFDTPQSQRQYVLRYLPTSLADSPTGQTLISRMWWWLRGRYRFTASFISCLLITQYEKPLHLLDAYISWFTGVDPPHMSKAVLQEQLSRSAFEAVHRFSPFRGSFLSDEPQILFAMHSAMFKIMLSGENHVRFKEQCFRLAAQGVAVLTDHKGEEALVLEPCIVLPLIDPIFRQPGVASAFFPDALASQLHKAPPHHTYPLAFVPTLVQALMKTKKTDKIAHRLCDLFLFPGIAPDWATQSAQLVRITRTAEKRALRATVFQPSFSKIAREHVWATESPEWLQHETNVPFCIASQFSQADLIFVLRLEDNRCLQVALSTLLKNEHVKTSPSDIQVKLLQLAPKNLFKVGQPTTASGAHFDDIPREVAEAGNPPLLRVVSTFPYEVDINEVERDKVPQPIATLNTPLLRECANSFNITDIVKRIVSVMTTPRSGKRKRPSVGDGGGEPERPKTRSMTKKEEEANKAARPRRGVPKEEVPLRKSTRRVPASSSTAKVPTPVRRRKR